MTQDNKPNNNSNHDSIFSKRLRAGKRRTYFFDVRTTKSNDYYLTITESKKKFNDEGYERHKVFLYKEDFNKFIEDLTEVVDHVKKELLPNFDFDAFSRREEDNNSNQNNNQENTENRENPKKDDSFKIKEDDDDLKWD